MTRPLPVEPVKLIVAVLWSDAAMLAKSLDYLKTRWGSVDYTGQDHPFDVTDYYEEEMGRCIRRRLISFQNLVPPESIREGKLECIDIEESLAGAGCRKVNLDVGYLDHSKVVLASAKWAGQKIHLGDGIYADMILRYRNARYRPFEWTFPDFRDGRYDTELNAIRRTYMAQLKLLRKNAGNRR